MEHQRRYFAMELSILRVPVAAVVVSALKLSSQLLYARLLEATVRVEVAVSTESAMSVLSS